MTLNDSGIIHAPRLVEKYSVYLENWVAKHIRGIEKYIFLKNKTQQHPLTDHFNLRRLIVSLFLFFELHSTDSLANSINDNTQSIIPIKFINNESMVDVKINGYQSTLIVDLGTTMADAMLFKTILKKSHAKYIGKIKGCYIQNYRGNKFSCNKYIINKFVIGSITLKNIQVFEFPGIEYFSDDTIKIDDPLNNGTIGMQLLKRFNIMLDYRNKKMIITQGNILNIERGKTPRLQSYKFYYGRAGNVLMKAKINNTPIIVMFDTGNNESTIRSSAALRINKFKYNSNIKRISIANFILESHNYGRQNFLMKNSNSEADVSLGRDFFVHHVVYFDFKNKIVAIGF